MSLRLFRDEPAPGENPAPGETPLAGREIAICGRLAALTRAEAARAIEQHGGLYVPRVRRGVSVVVLGGAGLPLNPDGRVAHPLARWRTRLDEQPPPEIWPEERLLRCLCIGWHLNAGSQFTAQQAAEMLGISRGRFDGWIRAQLVQPSEWRSGVPLFAFADVAAARTLAELFAAGVSLARVRRSLRQLAAWFPAGYGALAERLLAGHLPRILVRTPCGKLAEPSGQLVFEFEEPALVADLAFPAAETQEDLLARAAALEEADEPAAAAATYRRLIELHGDDADWHFNLGNALGASGDLAGALEAFDRCLALDPHHAPAWNNRAGILVEQGRLDEAEASYRRALALDPDYADAHFNLAQTLVEQGRPLESILHWRAYLAFDPDSAWSDEAWQALAEINARDSRH